MWWAGWPHCCLKKTISLSRKRISMLEEHFGWLTQNGLAPALSKHHRSKVTCLSKSKRWLSLSRTTRFYRQPTCLLACFDHNKVNTIREQETREQIAFDGKVVWGTGNGLSLNALRLMSAMVVETGLILYQQEVTDKTNEIPVMKAMLQHLSVRGPIITANAMHCQTKTAEGWGCWLYAASKRQPASSTQRNRRFFSQDISA